MPRMIKKKMICIYNAKNLVFEEKKYNLDYNIKSLVKPSNSILTYIQMSVAKESVQFGFHVLMLIYQVKQWKSNETGEQPCFF